MPPVLAPTEALAVLDVSLSTIGYILTMREAQLLLDTCLRFSSKKAVGPGGLCTSSIVINPNSLKPHDVVMCVEIDSISTNRNDQLILFDFFSKNASEF